MKGLERSQVQQLTHGIQYKPRNKQPSMYEILSWNDGQQKKTIFQQNQIKNQQQNNTLTIQNYNKNNYKKTTKPEGILKKLQFQQSPHKYKHELYSYNDQQKQKNPKNQQKIEINENKNNSRQKIKTLYKKNQQVTLNPNDLSDRKQIQKRKKKIKQFKLFSRQLPDSAFTTYYGKPAFSNYGSGSRSSQKKSFNIMPHAGQNHPQYQQSYQTALSRGKQIKQNFIPKKPLQIYHPHQQNMIESDYYSIPIHKPNLVNTMRFSQEKKYLQKKGSTPKHNQINRLPKRQYFQKNTETDYTNSNNKKKLKKVTSSKTFQTFKNQHPLVVSRDHLRQILAQKKKQQNRLAYKVTQCYPLPYQNCQKDCYQTKASRWTQLKPAGIVSPRSDHVQDVFYSSNVWN